MITLTDHNWYLEADIDWENASLTWSERRQSQTGMPMRHYHGFGTSKRLPKAFTEEAWDALKEDLQPLLDKIAACCESRWDGSNHKAHYTNEARALQEQVIAVISSFQDDCGIPDGGGYWDASDWLSASTHRQSDSDGRTICYEIERVGEIDARTTDADLAGLAGKIMEGTEYYGAVIGGLDNHLRAIRADCDPDASRE